MSRREWGPFISCLRFSRGPRVDLQTLNWIELKSLYLYSQGKPVSHRPIINAIINIGQAANTGEIPLLFSGAA